MFLKQLDLMMKWQRLNYNKIKIAFAIELLSYISNHVRFLAQILYLTYDCFNYLFYY
jgi:uncharacterized metal-binding protein